jgi:hypothetical protein
MTAVTLVSHRKEAVRALDNAASQRMLQAVIAVRNETQEVLSGTRHGRRYKVPTTGSGRVGEGRSRPGTGVWYTASAPGESPANRLNGLRSSVDYDVRGEGRKLIGDVGTKLGYGASLEYGTERMSARPWLRRSFERTLDTILDIWRRPWL